MLDVYLPNVWTAPRPVVVWIHGGAWMSGDKASPPGLGMLARGFVIVSIDYRTTQEAMFPSQIYDCKAAIRFLRAHAGQFDIDPGRIGVWGDSAGGHLAALLGTTNGLKEYEGDEGNAGASSAVQAVCDWFGQSDFLQGADLAGSGKTAAMQLLGGAPADHPESATLASPCRQAGRAPLPPFLIMHGRDDALVPLHQSQILFDKLQQAGDAAKLVVLANSGHGTGAFRSPQILMQVSDFFAASLKTSSGHLIAATTRPAT
jgi:acetyl esterase/lipase